MLRVASYQEALRAIGAMADRKRPVAPSRGPACDADTSHSRLKVRENERSSKLTVVLEGQRSEFSAQDLRALVTEARANRGSDGRYGGATSDLLRAVGLGLDELGARLITLELAPSGLRVRFLGDGETEHELSYGSDELAALRVTASARRKGEPSRRVLILHDGAAAAAPLRELLVAEFAVEDLPGSDARAIAQADNPPHLIVIHLSCALGSALMVDAIRALRDSSRTSQVPIVAVVGAGCAMDPASAFTAGVNDLLPEPFAPAQLRARLRTWLLRGTVAV